jgi:CMP-N-acetylneuraminic acid synthetase
MVNVMFIIPARGGSKRLKRKNMRTVMGKPMVQWAIEACKNSMYWAPGHVYVSSEDPEIIACAFNNGAEVIVRPDWLAEDHVWTQDVVQHAVEQLGQRDIYNIVVRIQANSPQVTGDTIDECINRLINDKLYEVFTINRQTLVEDGAIHVMKHDVVFQEALSVYKGVVLTDYIDVHDENDLLNVEKLMYAQVS